MWTIEQSRNVVFKRHWKCKKKGHNFNGKTNICNRCHISKIWLEQNEEKKTKMSPKEETLC